MTIFALKRGAGVPLVAIHGAGGTSRHWGGQLRSVGEVAQVLALDLPGHGRTPGPSHQTIAEAAASVLALLDQWALPQAIMMGHSMGGAIAQWLALHAPKRVAGLVLVGTGARLRVDQQIMAGIVADFTATTALITRRAYAPGTSPEVLAQATAELQQVAPAVLASDYAACDAFDAMAAIREVAVPALILVGAQDQLTPPKYSYWLHAALPDAELHVIPGAGHMVMIEQAALVNAQLRAWLARQSSR